MSGKYEIDVNRFSENLSGALSEVSALIQHIATEFGSTSPQAADCYLELRGILVINDQPLYPDACFGEASSQKRITDFDDSLLIQYLLHDPSQQEKRLQEVESALAGSLYEWVSTDPEKVRRALLALLDVASCWESNGDSFRANALTEKVVGLSGKYLEPADSVTVSALIDMAVHCFKCGKFDDTESHLKAALDICEKNPEAMGYYGSRVFMNLGGLAASRGQIVVAASYFDQALEGEERALAPDKHKILEILCNQAKAYLAMKQQKRFDQVASRALKEAKEYWKCDRDFATECMMTLFGLYQSQGRFDETRLISRTLVDLKGTGIPAYSIKTRSN